MSKIVILGAGISGHVAASHLRRKLSKDHEVVVSLLIVITNGFRPIFGSELVE